MQDKRLTQHVLDAAGLRVPVQQLAGNADDNLAFLEEHGAVVVKPVDGEQGQGVAVNLGTLEEINQAVEQAQRFDSRVLLESYHPGLDLRIVVIGFEVVAAAIRHPAQVIGDGKHSIQALIEAQSRRRQAATGGESRIPLDEETERTLRASGLTTTACCRLDNALPCAAPPTCTPAARSKTSPSACIRCWQTPPCAPRALDIPVVGLDLMVRDAEQPDYVIIEANERVGLANHEPQPTAERFVDLLFPHSQAPT